MAQPLDLFVLSSQRQQALMGTRDLLVFAEEKELFFNMGIHLRVVFVDDP